MYEFKKSVVKYLILLVELSPPPSLFLKECFFRLAVFLKSYLPQTNFLGEKIGIFMVILVMLGWKKMVSF